MRLFLDASVRGHFGTDYEIASTFKHDNPRPAAGLIGLIALGASCGVAAVRRIRRARQAHLNAEARRFAERRRNHNGDPVRHGDRRAVKGLMKPLRC